MVSCPYYDGMTQTEKMYMKHCLPHRSCSDIVAIIVAKSSHLLSIVAFKLKQLK